MTGNLAVVEESRPAQDQPKKTEPTPKHEMTLAELKALQEWFFVRKRSIQAISAELGRNKTEVAMIFTEKASVREKILGYYRFLGGDGEPTALQLKNWFEKEKINYPAIEKATGLSKTKISQYFNRQERIDSLLALKKRIEMQEAMPDIATGDFVMTSVAQEVEMVLKLAHLDHTMGMLYGDSGLGKTRAAREYAKKHPGLIFIECKSWSNRITIANELATALRIDRSEGSVAVLLQRAARALKGTGRMLVIDNAHFFKPQVLDDLWGIYDESGCSIVVMGVPKLWDRMSDRNGWRYDQFQSRVGVTRHVLMITGEDVRKWLAANGITDPKIVAEFDKKKNLPGHLRYLSQILTKLKRICDAAKCEPTVKHFEMAVKAVRESFV